MKQNAKAASGTAVKNSIQKVKQAAARVLNKASSVKSKGGALANRCGVELSKNKIEKRIGDPSKPFADEIFRNAKQTVAKISPSVKPVSGTQATCSAQVAVSSAEVELEAWSSIMWWLTLVDGPLPIGDIVYWSGVVSLAVAVDLTQEDMLSNVTFYKEHTKNKRKSTENKHQVGDSRRMRDQGGEKKKKKSDWKPMNPKRGGNNYVRMPRKVLF